MRHRVCCRCALEFALLHLLARARGVPSIAHLLQEAAAPCVAVQSHVRINGLVTRGESHALERAADALMRQAPSSGIGGIVGGGGGADGGDGQGGEPGGGGLRAARTWKLKVGGSDPTAEGARVGRLVRGCAALGVRLRLDANQAWAPEAAAAFCAALRAEAAAAGDGAPPPWPSLAPIDFCEEPLRAPCAGALQALHEAYSLPYALDESVLPAADALMSAPPDPSPADPSSEPSPADPPTEPSPGPSPPEPLPHGSQGGEARPPASAPVEDLRARLRAAGCAGLVVKPTLVGGVEASAALAAEAAAHGVDVIFTSAFESGVAHAHIALAAAALSGPSVAHGLSTYERLAVDVSTPPFRDTVTGDLVALVRAQAALDATADSLAACEQGSARKSRRTVR